MKLLSCIVLATAALGTPALAEQATKPATPPWGFSVLRAQVIDALEHVDESLLSPEKSAWLLVWVEVRANETDVYARDITVRDETGRTSQVVALDCGVPEGKTPAFLFLSDLRGRWPESPPDRAGIFSPVYNREGVQSGIVWAAGGRSERLDLFIMKEGDERLIEFGDKFAKKRNALRLVLLFPVAGDAKAFDLQIGAAPTVPLTVDSAQ